ncbi:MAG: class I SAM-dependent methyltransferase [Candidatus Obscuribacterales bacterium]|nr:class I SAM-dependent methyltransferase [Candidatus Obscuribacterales bacterium]
MLNQKARQETIKYHEEYYGKHALFEKGCWLEKPDQITLELADRLLSQQEISVLDLGCGVGRNAIPLAKKLSGCQVCVTGVDFLQIAVDKLLSNAETNQVAQIVKGVQSDFESFVIEEKTYDLILAISVLEHSSSYEAILAILDKIIAGTKNGGFNRLEFTTNRNVKDNKTGETIETYVETPLQSETLISMLKDKYHSWKIEHLELTPYEEVFVRDGREILWRSTQVNLVMQK